MRKARRWYLSSCTRALSSSYPISTKSAVSGGGRAQIGSYKTSPLSQNKRITTCRTVCERISRVRGEAGEKDPLSRRFDPSHDSVVLKSRFAFSVGVV